MSLTKIKHSEVLADYFELIRVHDYPFDMGAMEEDMYVLLSKPNKHEAKKILIGIIRHGFTHQGVYSGQEKEVAIDGCALLQKLYKKYCI